MYAKCSQWIFSESCQKLCKKCQIPYSGTHKEARISIVSAANSASPHRGVSDVGE